MMTSVPDPRLNASPVDGIPDNEKTTPINGLEVNVHRISHYPNMHENPGSSEHSNYNGGSPDRHNPYEQLRIKNNHQQTYTNAPSEEHSYQSLNFPVNADFIPKA